MKLYRCITPTDRLCPCGKVARELHRRATHDSKRIVERIRTGALAAA